MTDAQDLSPYDHSFRNWHLPHMARGDFTYNGHVIVKSYNLPKEHIADEIAPVPWPWPIRLFVKRPRRFDRGAKVERDMIVMAAGKVFVSPATWEALRARAAVQS